MENRSRACELAQEKGARLELTPAARMVLLSRPCEVWRRATAGREVARVGCRMPWGFDVDMTMAAHVGGLRAGGTTAVEFGVGGGKRILPASVQRQTGFVEQGCGICLSLTTFGELFRGHVRARESGTVHFFMGTYKPACLPTILGVGARALTAPNHRVSGQALPTSPCRIGLARPSARLPQPGWHLLHRPRNCLTPPARPRTRTHTLSTQTHPYSSPPLSLSSPRRRPVHRTASPSTPIVLSGILRAPDISVCFSTPSPRAHCPPRRLPIHTNPLCFNSPRASAPIAPPPIDNEHGLLVLVASQSSPRPPPALLCFASTPPQHTRDRTVKSLPPAPPVSRPFASTKACSRTTSYNKELGLGIPQRCISQTKSRSALAFA
ncbi:hypothetical protein Q7P37_004254 [Cladosporium fusiforme]